MEFLWISLAAVAVIVLAVLVIAYVCFRIAFYVPERQQTNEESFDIPEGEIYEPYREQMVAWMKEVRAMPHEDMSVTSFDGLTLRGQYYEYAPGAPIELMFHGYRGNAERDLCGGVQRCFALGRSALVVDQRASGRSDGNVISFGVNESRDCMAWLELMQKRFGPGARIILTGISMGAATVMMAADKELPSNVVGILADCGYTCARDIVKLVIRQMKLPVELSYPFVRLGARLYGHFDLEETSPQQALKNARVPVIFFHGEADAYVPCQMSRENFEACTAPKKLVTVPGAGHGLSYLVDPDGYLNELRQFAPCWGLETVNMN